MVFGGKFGKRRSIRSEDLFLEIIMIFGEKFQSAPNFKYPPLIGVAQNFIFQNWVAEQKSLRSPDLGHCLQGGCERWDTRLVRSILSC